MSPPVGPTGLPYECDGDSGQKSWRAGASGGAFATTIVFEGDRNVDIEQASVSATLGYQISTRTGVVGTAGGILGGTVDHGAEGDIGSGVVASVSATYLALFETEKRPFVLGSMTFGHSRTSAVSDDMQRHDWTAFDLRAGVMVGKTISDNFVPFASARVFGGPVSWQLGGEDVVGSDKYHYTVGLGATFRIPGKLDLFAEVLGLGEQSASVGGSVAF